MFDTHWVSRIENFCDILCKLHFAEKFKIYEICKLGSTQLGSTWSCLSAYGSSFWLYRFLIINDLNINFA